MRLKILNELHAPRSSRERNSAPVMLLDR
jgi:hypothetical protein